MRERDPVTKRFLPARLIVRVTEIPVNPRMVFAETEKGERLEVLVGRSETLWPECPLEVKPSADYPGFYDVVGELPKGRWDRAYAQRFCEDSVRG